MLVIMNREATEEQVRNAIDAIEEMGLKAHPIPGSMRTAIGITGNKGALEPALFESLDGVVQALGFLVHVRVHPSALDHEVGDDAVKSETVVETLIDVAQEVLHGDGGLRAIKFEHDIAQGGRQFDAGGRVLCRRRFVGVIGSRARGEAQGQ